MDNPLSNNGEQLSTFIKRTDQGMHVMDQTDENNQQLQDKRDKSGIELSNINIDSSINPKHIEFPLDNDSSKLDQSDTNLLGKPGRSDRM